MGKKNGTILTATAPAKVRIEKGGRLLEKVDSKERLVILRSIAERHDIPQFRAETDKGYEIRKEDLSKTFKTLEIRVVTLKPLIEATGM